MWQAQFVLKDVYGCVCLYTCIQITHVHDMFAMTVKSTKYLWQEIKEAGHRVACEGQDGTRPEDEGKQPLANVCIHYLFVWCVRLPHSACVEVRGELWGSRD